MTEVGGKKVIRMGTDKKLDAMYLCSLALFRITPLNNKTRTGQKFERMK